MTTEEMTVGVGNTERPIIVAIAMLKDLLAHANDPHYSLCVNEIASDFKESDIDGRTVAGRVPSLLGDAVEKATYGCDNAGYRTSDATGHKKQAWKLVSAELALIRLGELEWKLAGGFFPVEDNREFSDYGKQQERKQVPPPSEWAVWWAHRARVLFLEQLLREGKPDTVCRVHDALEIPDYFSTAFMSSALNELKSCGIIRNVGRKQTYRKRSHFDTRVVWGIADERLAREWLAEHRDDVSRPSTPLPPAPSV